MRTWLVCTSVACSGVAAAAPQADLVAQYERAAKLDDRGEYEKALALIEQELAAAPKDLPLLGRKGATLVKLREYERALDAYQAYLDAGAAGEDRSEAQRIAADLRAVKATFLEIALVNGPAEIYLDAKALGVFCRAEPSCTRALPPGEYKVVAERPGFEPWTGRITARGGQTARLAVTLIEQRSLLIVNVEPRGARITVDTTVYDQPTPIPAGAHRIVVTLEGHRAASREIIARQGKPIRIDIALPAIVPLRVEPPGAELFLDGRPIAIEDGGITVPAGAHVLVVRAPGFADRRIEIPATRGPDYSLAVAPSRADRGYRNLALLAGGAALVSVGAGALLGLPKGQLESRPSQFGYLAGGFLAAVAIGLWFQEPAPPQPARLAILPRLDSIAGLELAVRF